MPDFASLQRAARAANHFTSITIARVASLSLPGSVLKHRLRRSGRGPDHVVLQQIAIHIGRERGVVAERRNAADRVAGERAHRVGVGALQLFAEMRRDALLVDAIGARHEQQIRLAARRAQEHQRLDDLPDRDAAGGGRLLGGAGRFGHLAHRDVEAERRAGVLHLLRARRQFAHRSVSAASVR